MRRKVTRKGQRWHRSPSRHGSRRSQRLRRRFPSQPHALSRRLRQQLVIVLQMGLPVVPLVQRRRRMKQQRMSNRGWVLCQHRRYPWIMPAIRRMPLKILQINPACGTCREGRCSDHKVLHETETASVYPTKSCK